MSIEVNFEDGSGACQMKLNPESDFLDYVTIALAGPVASRAIRDPEWRSAASHDVREVRLALSKRYGSDNRPLVDYWAKRGGRRAWEILRTHRTQWKALTRRLQRQEEWRDVLRSPTMYERG